MDSNPKREKSKVEIRMSSETLNFNGRNCRRLQPLVWDKARFHAMVV